MSANVYDAGELIKKGVLLAKQRRFSDASKIFTRVIEFDESISQAYYLRGHARVKLKQFDGAVRDFKRTIRLDKQHAQAYFYLGVLLEQSNDLNHAARCFAAAARLGHQEATTKIDQLRQQMARPAPKQEPRRTPQISQIGQMKTRFGSMIKSDPSANGSDTFVPTESDTGEFISPTLSAKMRQSIEPQQAEPQKAHEEGNQAEEDTISPAEMVDVASDILKRFANAYCGKRVDTEETIQKGLFGLGKKVAKKVTRWRVRVKKRISDDHTGLLGESTLGATLEFNREPITRIRVSLPESDMYRVELQVEKEMGGMLKHQLTGLVTVWKLDVSGDAGALNDALQILISERYLVSDTGRLVYHE